MAEPEKNNIPENKQFEENQIIRYTKTDPYRCVENIMETERYNSIIEEHRVGDDCTVDFEQISIIEGSKKNVKDPIFKPDMAGSQNSDSEEYSEAIEKKNLEDENSRRKRSTKYEVNAKAWQENKNRINREKGKSYFGKKKEEGKWKYNLLKQPRSLMVSCNCKLSKCEKSILQCRRLQEDERQVIFKQFWEYTWPEKRVFVKGLVSVNQTARKRGQNEDSRRTYTNKFYLGKGRLRVCKTMFLNTLGVKEWVIKKWAKSGLENKKHEGLPDTESHQVQKTQNIKFLHDFFDSLPKLESHYCRASTSKLYLEPIWDSKAHVYRIYRTDFCKNHNDKPVSIATFHKEFDKKRLCLYRPKKDLCDTCVAFDTGNLTQEKYDEHQGLKNEAREEKSRDKESPNEVLCMDLQSVLLCPRSNVCSLYYKTKLIVHNFTFYDMKRQQGHCYLWNETEGGLSSNEFTSIVVHFLQKHIEANPLEYQRELIIYSDGCGYQNRNTTLSNALLNFAIDKNITIVQKYLQKGHTQMEVDSVHSVIERKLRNKKINVPADYVTVCETACQKAPYKVEYLLHNFFRKFDEIHFLKSIRPGKVSGAPTVNDLKALKYSRDGIFYKLRHPEDWQPLPVRVNFNDLKAIKPKDLPQLHKNRLRIKSDKFQHLQQLKSSLKPDYHDFFNKLPHD